MMPLIAAPPLASRSSRAAEMIASVMAPLNVIVQAAANIRWDPEEKDPVREAADLIITHVLPLSSHGDDHRWPSRAVTASKGWI